LGVALLVTIAALPTAAQVYGAGPTSAIYSTDFENVTKASANTLNMGINNWFEFQAQSSGSGGGATMWMEGLDRQTPGITCHSGTRCVGMELTDITKSRRNEFNLLNIQNVVGDELFVSVWLYLSADWPIQGSSSNWSWYEIVNPFFSGGPSYVPYTAIHIRQDPNFRLTTNYVDLTHTEHMLDSNPDFPVPRGRWFQVQYYVLRSTTNGVLKVWFDGRLVTDRSGIQTKGSTEEYFTTPAKIYYNTDSRLSSFKIWVDDLQIYSTQPPLMQSTPIPPILMLSANGRLVSHGNTPF
jgi:hypothetical protein